MERVFDLELVLAEVRRALEAGRVEEAVRVLSYQRPADMVDVFTFQDGKIRVKNAFRKQRPALPARA